MENRHTFPEVMLQTAIAAIACMLFHITNQTDNRIPVVLYVLFFAYALVSYLISRLFLSRPRSLLLVIILHLFLMMAGFAAAILLQQITGAVSGIFFGLIYLVLSVMAVRETTVGLRSSWLTLCFDILAALLLIDTLFTELGNGQLTAVLPGVAGLIAALSGIMVLRDGSLLSGRIWLLRLIIILLIAAAAFLICLAAGDSLRNGVSGVFAGIGAAFSWLGNLIKEILLFFSRLFPDQNYEAVVLDMGSGISMSGTQVEEEITYSPLPLIILGGLLLAAVVIAVIIIFRKHRFSGKKTAERSVKKAGKRKNRVSLREALKRFIRELLYGLRVRIFFLRNRKTPAGRYYRLVRSGKRTGHALRQGETPQDYILRRRDALPSGDRRIPELTRLVDELNMQLYRGHTET